MVVSGFFSANPVYPLRPVVKQAMNAADALCKCKSPPAPSTPELPYPLALPVPKVRKAATRWQDICVEHLV